MSYSFAYPRLASLSAALAMALSVGCSSETGIIIEVSTADLEVEPDTLHFYVGVKTDAEPVRIDYCDLATRYTDEAPLADRLVPVENRDLTTSPYKLLLSPDEALNMNRKLMVAVVAIKDQQIIGAATLETPVEFVGDKVVSWPLVIESSLGETRVTPTDCLCATTSNGRIAIVPPDDADCDLDVGEQDCDDNNPSIGKNKPEICDNGIDDNCRNGIDEETDEDEDGVSTCDGDCNDSNANVYPGAPEICDGYDNDCEDTPRYPEYSDCYVTSAEGTCAMGIRRCEDYISENGGWDRECMPKGTEPHYEASPVLCDEFVTCLDEGYEYFEAAQCADDRIFDDVECTQFLFEDTALGIHRPCPGGVRLGEDAFPDDVCKWVLMGGVDQDGYSAQLRGLNGDLGTTGAVIEACLARLNIFEAHSSLPEDPPSSEFRLWSTFNGNLDQHLRFKLYGDVLEDNEECPFNGGLECSNLPSLPPLPGG